MTANQGPVPRPRVIAAQDELHDEQFKYSSGSPHLRHPKLRRAIVRDLEKLVKSTIESTGQCHAVEIGAGHGDFTETLLAAGASVTVTEASHASAESLRERYRNEPRVTVLYDETGEECLSLSAPFDLVVCISVLHHIPDYLGFVDALTGKLRHGGSFYSVQDPLWYPRLPRVVHYTHMAAYFAWRLGQGNYRRGFATRVRRLRGVYNESVSDLVEYHVVRSGVDELAILEILERRFESAQAFSYWSTQAPVLQFLGERTRFKTNFGVVARTRLEVSD